MFVKKKKLAKIYLAIDEKDNVHASIYMVWDKISAYYLTGGADPVLRNSGATSLLMYTAIKDMAEYVNTFDFEGSMIESIERFFSSFGTIQKPYFQISKINNPILKAYQFLKG